jgi:RNA polymerase sigma-70 factor, ECF subfamily
MKETLSDIEDQLLVMDAQDGDAKAMEELVRRWQERLWRHALRLTSNRDAAWDVTQDSWLGIIKGLRKLHDPASFKAWAYKITTNKSIDWIRKNNAAKLVGIEDVQPSQPTERSDLDLHELMDRLDVRKKAVLSLYYLEQLTVPEISLALDLPQGTVKSRLHSARRELKKLWQKHVER